MAVQQLAPAVQPGMPLIIAFGKDRIVVKRPTIEVDGHIYRPDGQIWTTTSANIVRAACSDSTILHPFGDIEVQLQALIRKPSPKPSVRLTFTAKGLRHGAAVQFNAAVDLGDSVQTPDRITSALRKVGEHPDTYVRTEIVMAQSYNTSCINGLWSGGEVVAKQGRAAWDISFDMPEQSVRFVPTLG